MLDKFGKPYGSVSDLSGFGPPGIYISLARDAVPQGIAAVTTCIDPDRIRSMQMDTESSSARFSFTVGILG